MEVEVDVDVIKSVEDVDGNSRPNKMENRMKACRTVKHTPYESNSPVYNNSELIASGMRPEFSGEYTDMSINTVVSVVSIVAVQFTRDCSNAAKLNALTHSNIFTAWTSSNPTLDIDMTPSGKATCNLDELE